MRMSDCTNRRGTGQLYSTTNDKGLTLMIRLDKGIQATSYLVADLKNFNNDQYAVRYPHLKTTSGEPSTGEFDDKTTYDLADGSGSRPGMSRRTMTFADEPSTSTSVIMSTSPAPRQTIKRSLTLATNAAEHPQEPATSSGRDDDEDAFSILRLDVNMGVTRNAKMVISHLEKQSIAKLLNGRFSAALDHLAVLQRRIHDPQSRVLVTGDLNAGKSTLVNALLRRNEVMPTDQQPLTTRFVEVISAKENAGLEEIHILDKPGKYDIKDHSTFTTLPIDKLESMVTDETADADSPPLRVFLREAAGDLAHPSILHNGVVDISLIDAPGLNRDSIKTTANFARQEEIDVIVFVVSAANHFTLSAKDFILQAGHEKAHLFIVVNRFDQIKDKERCRRLVLEQIRQLSPQTYADAADLVHFVDSAKVAFGCCEDAGSDVLDQAFAHLEHSLRSFVLINRAKSKLGPSQNYVTRLLADVELLSSANLLHAIHERDAARQEIAQVKPVLEKLKRGKEGLEEGLLAEEEKVTEQVMNRSRDGLDRALERIGRGELAASGTGAEMPLYPGLLGVWDYARDCRKALLTSLEHVITIAEQDARQMTKDGVEHVVQLGEKHLPADVDRSRRIFNPNAMFAPRSGKSVATVGLARQGLSEVHLSDIFDIHHHISSASSRAPSPSSELVTYMPEFTGFGAASLAVGAFTVGGKALGMRSIVEGIVRASEIAANPAARRWIGPILGIVTLGAVAYVVYDLPQAIPRNVGRQIQATLTVSSGMSDDSESVPFAEHQSVRVAKETRKVMRLAAWDLRERHRGALDARLETIRMSEDSLRRALSATAFFEGVDKKVGEVREVIGIKV